MMLKKILFIFILFIVILSIYIPSSSALWDNLTYVTYNTPNNGTRPIQYILNVTNSTGTNNATDVFIDCKTPNCDDIGFELNNLENLPYYWKTYPNGSNAGQLILNITGNGTIGLHYGNQFNSAYNNSAGGEATFQFYEDCLSGGLSSSKWTITQSSVGNVACTSGEIRLTGNNDYTTNGAVSTKSFTTPFILEMDTKISAAGTYFYYGLNNALTSPALQGLEIVYYTNLVDLLRYSNGVSLDIGDATANNYYKTIFKFNNTGYIIERNGTVLESNTTWTQLSNQQKIILDKYATLNYGYADNIFVRSYTPQVILNTTWSNVTLIKSYYIDGYISKAGYGIDGVTVMDNITLSSNISNGAGYYIIKNLQNGTYNISFTKNGYMSNYSIVTINGNNVTNVNSTLFLDTNKFRYNITCTVSNNAWCDFTRTIYNLNNVSIKLRNFATSDDSSTKFRFITINSLTTITDYQLNINTSNYSMKPDYGDVYFQDINNNNLSFYLDSYDANWASFYVKVNLSAGNNIIQMKYGNSSKTSTSNGSNTFIQYNGYTSSNYHLSNSVTVPFIYEALVKVNAANDQVYFGLNDNIDFTSGTYALMIIPVDSTPSTYFQAKNTTLTNQNLTPTFTDNVNYSLKITAINTSYAYFNVTGNSQSWYINTTTNVPNGAMGMGMYIFAGIAVQYKSYVRKYIDQIPTYSIGIEHSTLSNYSAIMNGNKTISTFSTGEFVYPQETYTDGKIQYLINNSDLNYLTDISLSGVTFNESLNISINNGYIFYNITGSINETGYINYTIGDNTFILAQYKNQSAIMTSTNNENAIFESFYPNFNISVGSINDTAKEYYVKWAYNNAPITNITNQSFSNLSSTYNIIFTSTDNESNTLINQLTINGTTHTGSSPIQFTNAELSLGTYTAYLNVTDNNGTLGGNPTWVNKTSIITIFEDTSCTGCTISIGFPVQYYITQRDNLNYGKIPISGSYTGYGGKPTAIEARFNGSSWVLINSTPSGNKFIGNITGYKGQGLLEVRFADNISITSSISNISVGDIYVITGQSNAVGYGDNYNTPNISNPYIGSLFKENPYSGGVATTGQWTQLTDPTANDQGQGIAKGSPWVKLGDRIMQEENVPVGFITTGWGGLEIYDWLPDASNPDGAFFAFQNMMNMVNLSTNNTHNVKAVLWHQGESDVENSATSCFETAGCYETRSRYLFAQIHNFMPNATILTTVIQNVPASYNPTLTSYRYTRSAQIKIARENNTNYTGFGAVMQEIHFLTPTAFQDGHHFATDADMLLHTNRWWAAVNRSIYGSTIVYPELIRAEYRTSNRIVLFINVSNPPLTPSTGLKGFKIVDGASTYTDSDISSAIVQNDNQINITLVPSISKTSTISLGDYLQTDPAVVVAHDSSYLSLPIIPFYSEPLLDMSSISSPEILSIVNGSVGDTWGIVNYTLNQTDALSHVEYSTNSDLSGSLKTTNLTTGLNRSHNLTGLNNGTKYYFKIWAYNNSDNTVYSNSTNYNFTTNSNITGVTNATPEITNVVNGTTSYTWALINYTVNQSNSLSHVEYSTLSDLSSSINTSNLTNGLNRTHNITGLINNTKYYYRILAYNYSNSSLLINSSIYNFTTLQTETFGNPDITSFSPSLVLTVDVNNVITFNAGSNQSVQWSWTGATEGIGDGTTNSTSTRIYSSTGDFSVSVICFNINGTCTNSKTWNVHVVSDGSGGGINYDFLTVNVTNTLGAPISDAYIQSIVENAYSGILGTYTSGYLYVDGNTYIITTSKSGYIINSTSITFTQDHKYLNITLNISTMPAPSTPSEQALITFRSVCSQNSNTYATILQVFSIGVMILSFGFIFLQIKGAQSGETQVNPLSIITSILVIIVGFAMLTIGNYLVYAIISVTGC